MPLYTFSGMTVTSAPVSILHFTLTFLITLTSDFVNRRAFQIVFSSSSFASHLRHCCDWSAQPMWPRRLTLSIWGVFNFFVCLNFNQTLVFSCYYTLEKATVLRNCVHCFSQLANFTKVSPFSTRVACYSLSWLVCVDDFGDILCVLAIFRMSVRFCDLSCYAV